MFHDHHSPIPISFILRSPVQPGVSKDGPLVSECAAHPSRQAFGLPQDEVAGMKPGEGREGFLPGTANKKTAGKARRSSFWMVRVVTGL